jgi:hypothetical protein
MPHRTYTSSALAAADVLAAAVSLTATLGDHNRPLETTPIQEVALTAQLMPSTADRGPRRDCWVVQTPMPLALALVGPIPPRPGARRPCVAL